MDDLYARLQASPQLARVFAGVEVQHLRAYQHAFITSDVRGPEICPGDDGAAERLWITDEKFDATTVIARLMDAIAGLGLPDEIFRRIRDLLESQDSDGVITSTDDAAS